LQYTTVLQYMISRIVLYCRRKYCNTNILLHPYCIVCLEFHVSHNSRNTKLANGGDDRGLSDIWIALCVSIKLMPVFSKKALTFQVKLTKHFFCAKQF